MKPKILLIDDEEGIRKLLGISLRDAGYPVSIAIDGERGIELFQEESPEIVLTDIKMPGLDGIEVLRRIKAMSPDTEVIVITGHGEMELAIQSLQLDASDFITKPIHDEALFVALRRAEEKLAWRRALKHYNEDLKTKVREATEELKKNYALQEKLLQSSLDAFIGTDREGNIILFNQSAQQLSGYTLEELQGIPDPLIRLVPEWSAVCLPGDSGTGDRADKKPMPDQKEHFDLQDPGEHPDSAFRQPAPGERPNNRRYLLPPGPAGNGSVTERVAAGGAPGRYRPDRGRHGPRD